MHQPSGISEGVLEYSLLKELLRTIPPDESVDLFDECTFLSFFVRRIRSDPAFRFSILSEIIGDSQASASLGEKIIPVLREYNRDRSAQDEWIRMLADDPEILSSLFAKGTDRPIQFWQRRRTKILFNTFIYPTAFQTATPVPPPIPHPMDRAIIRFFWQGTHADTGGEVATPELDMYAACSDAITAFAVQWFVHLPRDGAHTILNKQQPEDAWQNFVEALLPFDPSADDLLEGAQFCMGYQLNEAARTLYSAACTKTDNPATRRTCLSEMALLSLWLGDDDRAFSEFQSAHQAAKEILPGEETRSAGIEDELIYLCETTEKLRIAEERGSCFDRLIRLAETLAGEQRIHALLHMAASCRRCGLFDREYTILELLLDEDDTDEMVFSRLDILNKSMKGDGTHDTKLLLNLEVQAESNRTLSRGILAFGSFGFSDAQIWFNRSRGLQNTPEGRLWHIRSAWYAGTKLFGFEVSPDDTLETQILHALSVSRRPDEAVAVLLAGGREVDEDYDGVLVLLEALMKDSAADAGTKLAGMIREAEGDQARKARIFRIAGKVFSECGIPDALTFYRKALRATTEKEERAMILSEIAYWYETGGQAKRSADVYRQAVALNPKFPGGWYGLARTSAMLLDYESAGEAIAEAIRYGPERDDLRIFERGISEIRYPADPDKNLLQAINRLDRRLFTWGVQVPLEYVRQYHDVTGKATEESRHDIRNPEKTGMVSLDEAVRMRNDMLAC
ncbi:MAG: hypothetical protein D5R99_04400 [Methanocalculus sp. MSAO_Arc1]|uniref:tetratricopeptide repeat protein n=1 Tax=Methanocalculus TaxID=71151 RepID=UPI000FF63791|nr:MULTISPECIES: hypothetical protein [unclassified Methanocalculus]MCP1663008.1 tetratricopeptide (TPR) repeat protein [Methanocalculus sp. AMF5]RQD80616.1 MAG: hypothetical protein D5R99_04400 [Methanocalculus sp. MSAO_Arc1]